MPFFICNGPVRNRGRGFRIVSSTVMSIATTLVIIRILDKLLITKLRLCWDDWTTVMSIVVDLANTVICVGPLVDAGLGRDMWTLTPVQVTAFVRIFYVTELLYLFCVASVKLALIFFYLRVFPTLGLRRLLRLTSIFIVMYTIAFVAACIWQCHPISYYWTRWDSSVANANGSAGGSCRNANAMAWCNAGISIVLDVWVLALPLWQLKGLNLLWKKKMGVVVMFCVGTL